MAGDEKKIMIITVGLPGSGKTMWARRAGFNRTVSLDDWREKLWGDRNIQDGPGGFEMLLALHNREIEDALEKGENVVVHNTNLLRKHRSQLVEMAHKANYHVKIIYFEIPVEVCRQRNRDRKNPVPDEVIDYYAAILEVPLEGEADCVVRYSNII
ncbi:MAG: AAA family ATPase [Desulfobacterales bacterium]